MNFFTKKTREVDIRGLMPESAKPTGEYESVDIDVDDLMDESIERPTEPAPGRYRLKRQ